MSLVLYLLNAGNRDWCIVCEQGPHCGDRLRREDHQLREQGVGWHTRAHAHTHTHTHTRSSSAQGAEKVRGQLRPVDKETEVTPEVKAAVTGAREITGELVTTS